MAALIPMMYIIELMKLRIDDAELEKLLAEHSRYIGKSLAAGASDIIGGAGWPMAAFASPWPAYVNGLSALQVSSIPHMVLTK